RTKTLVEEVRKWVVVGLLGLMAAGGKSMVRDAVSDGIAPLREQVRQLELKVAKLEAGQERRYNTER
ncbi:MAG: hypothetical protein EBS84_22910, partial [Proteobacteria bacterium]|nr:hypothetical protein [Pseudomonadota bacterium]